MIILKYALLCMLFTTIPVFNTLEAEICDCASPRNIGIINLDKFTVCEDPPKEVRPRQVDYRLHTNKLEVAKFPAYLCKATIESVTLRVFFFGSYNTEKIRVFDI